MTNQSTMDKLIEMRLTAMSDAFRNQLKDTKMKDIPFEDRFGMLVDIELRITDSRDLSKAPNLISLKLISETLITLQAAG